MYKKTLSKGYMTLEASLLMPFILFLLVFLIYLNFYMYDRCVLYQDAYTLCLLGTSQKSESAVDYINENMVDQFGQKYFATGGVSGDAEKSGTKVSVTASCGVQVPFTNALTQSDSSGWQTETEASASNINPTSVIRTYRMAGNIWKQVKELVSEETGVQLIKN